MSGFRDRYGQLHFSTDSIVIFDADVDYDGEVFEEHMRLKLTQFDRELFVSAYEVDLGAGADWPFVAYEVINEVIPFSLVAAALFAGEQVEKSVCAWTRLASKLMSLLRKRTAFPNATGAALLAVSGVLERWPGEKIQLVGYTWIDTDAANLEGEEAANAIYSVLLEIDQIDDRARQFDGGLHSRPAFLFKFAIGDRVVMASVRGQHLEIFVDDGDG